MLIFADRKGGFPHSEITGSKGARASPVLIAACHVLHRLSMPRHPSEALMRLIVLSKTHDRTDVRACALSDLMLAKHALYQLSYGPISKIPWAEPHSGELSSSRPPARLVGPGRLELPTLRLSGVRSNHLSYGPMAARRPNTGPMADAMDLRPTGLAIAPPDLSAGGEWKEKRRRRHPACFFSVFRCPNRL
jgi:hypothetical protein